MRNNDTDQSAHPPMSKPASCIKTEPVLEAYLTAAELGELLKLAPRTVRRRVKSDGWPHWGEGAWMRFSPEDVAAIKAMYAQPARNAPTGPVLAFDVALAIKGIQLLNRRKQLADARDGKPAEGTP
jgi:hypothetical protein